MEVQSKVQYRNHSIGAFFGKVQRYPESRWIYFGISHQYQTFILPSKIYYKGEYSIQNIPYYVPPYMIHQVPHELLTDTFVVRIVKVEIHELGKGRYLKLRPYAVKVSRDAYKMFEKLGVEEKELHGAILTFDPYTHPLFAKTDGAYNSHVKFALREAIRWDGDKVPEGLFSEEDFEWPEAHMKSLHNGLQYVMSESEERSHYFREWQRNRLRTARTIKNAFIA